MLQSPVAPTLLTSRTTRDIEKPNVLCAAESSVTPLRYLHRSNPRCLFVVTRVDSKGFVLSFSISAATRSKQLPRFLISSELLQSDLTHPLLPSTLVTLSSLLVTRHSPL